MSVLGLIMYFPPMRSAMVRFPLPKPNNEKIFSEFAILPQKCGKEVLSRINLCYLGLMDGQMDGFINGW